VTYLLNTRHASALRALAGCPLALPVKVGRKCCAVPWTGAATQPTLPALTVSSALSRARYRVTWKDRNGRSRQRTFPRRGLRGSAVDQALGFQRRLPYACGSVVDLQTSGKDN
jgi:hypothetical protein